MPELKDRLQSMLKPEQTGKVTPARIERFTKGDSEWTGEDVYNNLPFEVINERFLSNHGNVKLDQRRRFIHDARRLLRAGYTPSQLIQINEDCVKKNGTIIEEELQKLLRGEEEI